MSYSGIPWETGARFSPYNMELMDSAIKQHDQDIETNRLSIDCKPGKIVGITREIFNDYENNQAITPYASASGTKSTAGWKGYPVLMSEYHPSDPEMKNILLVLEDKELETKAVDVYSVGDIVNLDAQSHTYDKFTINQIHLIEGEGPDSLTNGWGLNEYIGNTVVVLVSYDVNGELTQIAESSFTLSSDHSDNWLWCIDKLAGIPITTQEAPIALGIENIAAGNAAFSAGRQNKSNGDYSATVGRANKAGYSSFAMGRNNNAMGMYAFAAGSGNVASGIYSAAFGNNTKSYGAKSVAFGNHTTANGENSVAFGMSSSTGVNALGATAFGVGSKANGNGSVAMGELTEANGSYSVAMGYKSNAKSSNSFALGTANAEASYAVAIGNGAIASGYMSFAQGSSLASGEQSIAFGMANEASGQTSLVAGNNSKAVGRSAVAIGSRCNAGHNYSVAMGALLSTKAPYQAVFGKFSKMTSDMLFGIGDGLGNKDEGDANEYRNAFSVFSDGTANIRTGLNTPKIKSNYDTLELYTNVQISGEEKPLGMSLNGEYYESSDIYQVALRPTGGGIGSLSGWYDADIGYITSNTVNAMSGNFDYIQVSGKDVQTKITSGTNAPDDSFGADGDIYIQIIE